MTWWDDNALLRPASMSGNSKSWVLCRGQQARAKGDNKTTREVTTPTVPSHKSMDGSQDQPQPIDHQTGPQWRGRAEAKPRTQVSGLWWGWARCKSGHGHSHNTTQKGTKGKGLSFTAAAGQSRGDPRQASHCSFTLTFFSAVWSQVAHLHQVRAGREPRQPKPQEMGDEAAEPLGAHRTWTTRMTWHLSSFFLGWKGQRQTDCIQGETRQVHRREIHWGLLNTQKTQPAEEIPKLKTEVRRLLQGNILFAFPGFALPWLSLTAIAGDRILSWRRPWSDLGHLLWWNSWSH